MDDAASSPVQLPEPWPDLPLSAWQDSYAALHLMTQIVGKIRLVQSPWLNHSWHVTFYLTARGLTTSPIPYGSRILQIDFDFIAHRLRLRTNDGVDKSIALRARPVADFYQELFAQLRHIGMDISIDRMPNEIADPIRFDLDQTHCAYDPEYVERWWRVLLQADRVMKKFRAGFIGKCSPVHFFWGSFDLAVTRFSGRTAPQHPGGVPHCPDWVTREAYSHEVSSCGFWPGGGPVPYPVFYSYAWPEPAAFSSTSVRPPEAFYDPNVHEFILPYEAVRRARAPDAILLEFFQTTYEAAANAARWDRAAQERSAPLPH